jgi:uncharacterized protein
VPVQPAKYRRRELPWPHCRAVSGRHGGREDTMLRSDVQFESEGATLRGWFYKPASLPPHPVVVMAHCTTATISMVTDRYAESLVETGFAALLYDHRNFGASAGGPRQQINPWIQARGYRDAVSYALSRDDVDPTRIALWGDSYSAMQAIVVAAADRRVRAVVAQLPTCGSEPPRFDTSDALFERLCQTLEGGDVRPTAESTTGPMPVVSSDQIGTPSLLKPIQAFRWFIEYGGRPGSRWQNLVTRVIPPTPVPFAAQLAAPYLQADLLMMVAPDDEMVHCNAAVARSTFDAVASYKEYREIEGGHFGLLYHPGELFDRATAIQRDFLVRRLVRGPTAGS